MISIKTDILMFVLCIFIVGSVYYSISTFHVRKHFSFKSQRALCLRGSRLQIIFEAGPAEVAKLGRGSVTSYIFRNTDPDFVLTYRRITWLIPAYLFLSWEGGKKQNEALKRWILLRNPDESNEDVIKITRTKVFQDFQQRKSPEHPIQTEGLQY